MLLKTGLQSRGRASDQLVDLFNGSSREDVGVEHRQIDSRGSIRSLIGLTLQVRIDALIGQNVRQVVAVIEPIEIRTVEVVLVQKVLLVSHAIILRSRRSHEIRGIRIQLGRGWHKRTRGGRYSRGRLSNRCLNGSIEPLEIVEVGLSLVRQVVHIRGREG